MNSSPRSSAPLCDFNCGFAATYSSGEAHGNLSSTSSNSCLLNEFLSISISTQCTAAQFKQAQNNTNALATLVYHNMTSPYSFPAYRHHPQLCPTRVNSLFKYVPLFRCRIFMTSERHGKIRNKKRAEEKQKAKQSSDFSSLFTCTCLIAQRS